VAGSIPHYEERAAEVCVDILERYGAGEGLQDWIVCSRPMTVVLGPGRPTVGI